MATARQARKKTDTKSAGVKISSKMRFQLYEASVQDPVHQIHILEQIYQDYFLGSPLVFREDFSASFFLSAEWVKSNESRSALALDIDPAPLKYGEKHHRSQLTADEQERLSVLEQDVISVTKPRADIIYAGNFSFYTFHQRKQLVEYLKCCRRSLSNQGVLMLEMVGGPGFVDVPHEEHRDFSYENGKGKQKFRYYWEHLSFNSVTRIGEYAIHFRLKGGEKYERAFFYHWRVWTIPEVRDCLEEAGFSDVKIYLEPDEDSNVGEPVELIDHEHDTWLCYLTASR